MGQASNLKIGGGGGGGGGGEGAESETRKVLTCKLVRLYNQWNLKQDSLGINYHPLLVHIMYINSLRYSPISTRIVRQKNNE